jgi:hypothetical protein
MGTPPHKMGTPKHKFNDYGLKFQAFSPTVCPTYHPFVWLVALVAGGLCGAQALRLVRFTACASRLALHGWLAGLATGGWQLLPRTSRKACALHGLRFTAGGWRLAAGGLCLAQALRLALCAFGYFRHFAHRPS